MRLLIVVVLAFLLLPLAAAQDAVVLVDTGETLVVQGTCDDPEGAVLRAAGTVIIRGTVMAEGVECDGSSKQAANGTGLLIEAPLIILQGAVLAADHGRDASDVVGPAIGADIRSMGGSAAPHGGHGGAITLRGDVLSTGFTVVLANGGRGGNLSYTGPVEAPARLQAGHGGAMGTFVLDGALEGEEPRLQGGMGGHGGGVRVVATTHASAPSAPGADLTASAGNGGDGLEVGGNGGDAIAVAWHGANGADGLGDNAMGMPGGKGGDAVAMAGNGGAGTTPGDGGSAAATAGHGGHGGHARADPCTERSRSGGDGGAGGMATATAGLAPKGATGGNGRAIAGDGGDGGDAIGLGGVGGKGGAGGTATATAAAGSTGGPLAAGGQGGAGGDGRELPGPGGDGGSADLMDQSDRGAFGPSGVATGGDGGSPGTFLGDRACEDIEPPTVLGGRDGGGARTDIQTPGPGLLLVCVAVGVALAARRKL